MIYEEEKNRTKICCPCLRTKPNSNYSVEPPRPSRILCEKGAEPLQLEEESMNLLALAELEFDFARPDKDHFDQLNSISDVLMISDLLKLGFELNDRPDKEINESSRMFGVL